MLSVLYEEHQDRKIDYSLRGRCQISEDTELLYTLFVDWKGCYRCIKWAWSNAVCRCMFFCVVNLFDNAFDSLETEGFFYSLYYSNMKESARAWKTFSSEVNRWEITISNKLIILLWFLCSQMDQHRHAFVLCAKNTAGNWTGLPGFLSL